MDDRVRAAKILFRQATMVSSSMIMSVFIYGGIGFYAVQTGHPAAAVVQGGTYRLVQLGAFAVAALAIIGSRLLAEKMFARRGTGIPGMACHPKQCYVSAIICCAAAELPAVLGMSLLFLSRDIYGFIPFAVFSLAALVFSFPQKQKWAERIGFDF